MKKLYFGILFLLLTSLGFGVEENGKVPKEVKIIIKAHRGQVYYNLERTQNIAKLKKTLFTGHEVKKLMKAVTLHAFLLDNFIPIIDPLASKSVKEVAELGTCEYISIAWDKGSMMFCSESDEGKTLHIFAKKLESLMLSKHVHPEK